MLNKYAELISAIDDYSFFATARKVHGPYMRPDGRQIVIVIRDDGSRITKSYPKFIMEEHMGRELDPNTETVDHLDFNKHNNDITNLRIVPRDVHSADDTRRVKLIKLKCSLCKKEFERSPRIIRDKSKKGVGGQFCSRKCAGIYSRKLQMGLLKKKKTPAYIKSEYYRRKNVKAFINYALLKYS
jgi:hypothetical protein